MVLTATAGNADAVGVPRHHRAGGRPRRPQRQPGDPGRRRGPRWRDETGSQAVEFALVLPGAVLVLVALLHAALVGMDLVAVQGLAREAARAAAVTADDEVEADLREAAGDRAVELELSPPDEERVAGELVTATVRLRSRGFAAFGTEVWLPARATMRVEDT